MKKSNRDQSITYLITASRRIWRWSVERRIVLKRAKVGKGWRCELCKTVGYITEKILKNGKKRKVMPVQVDHIKPIGEEPVLWMQVGSWLMRLFCGIANLQCLCRECHKTKTNREKNGRKK